MSTSTNKTQPTTSSKKATVSKTPTRNTKTVTETVSPTGQTATRSATKKTSAARSSAATTAGAPVTSALPLGFVSFVGSGPGDPELLTVRAVDLLRTAEIVVTESPEHAALVASFCPAAEVVDVVGPSGMMDGQVGAIRSALDGAGHQDVVILAYSAKYASAFYGPFREAVDSSLQGDRRTYQQDGGNVVEGVREALLDVEEGADIVMVKPALAYLDVVRAVREAVDVPVAAFNISGEYAMVEAAAANGWIDRDAAILETLTSIRRAGADVVLTYWAAEVGARLASR